MVRQARSQLPRELTRQHSVCRQGEVPRDTRGLATRREHVRYCQSTLQVLARTSLEVIIKRRLATRERCSIVSLRIEQRNRELRTSRRHQALAFHLGRM